AGKILKDEPMNIKVQEALGFIAEREKNYPSAVEYYQKITEYKPDAHIAHYNLARVLFQTGAVLPALNHARTAEALSPLPEYRVLVQKIMSRTQLREGKPLKAAKEPPSRP
ncbi:MAG: hypothetical protein ACU841_17375, partial [Gammaproteobacteria bacterium]